MRNKLKLVSVLLSASLVLGGCSFLDSVKNLFKGNSNSSEPALVVEDDTTQKPSDVEPAPEPQPEPQPEPEPEPEIEQAVFPAKEVIAFFEEAGLDVVVTSYSSANLEVEYEIDDSFEGYFDVYVTGSSHEEMEAYKDALILDGWSVIGENEGDFRLQFGETNACVDLVDFEDYICISFFVKAEVATGMSPEETVTDIASWFGGSVSEVQEGVFATYGAFSASAYSVEDMKGYVSSLFVPEEFELASDWSEENGAEGCVYVNAVLTVLEIYVYSETLYVDGDGYIVDEGTEGATAVEATCIEVYSYTYSE